MINDMASLKQAMEHMDAEDAAVAQAAKDRAAQILADARLDFAKLAELIEQRRLLLRPRILASIKRMDQPASLGDAAFRDTHASLRKEGQSFRQIAEALELSGGAAHRDEEQALRSELDHRMEPDRQRDDPASTSAPPVGTHLVSFPLRHPIRFLVIAVLMVMLVNALRDFAGSGRQIPGYRASMNARQNADAAMSSAGSLLRRRSSEQAGTPPTPPAPVPSTSPADQPAPTASPAGPAASSAPVPAAPAANESAAPSPSASPSAPVPSTPPRAETKSGPPPAPRANDPHRTARLRSLDDLMPDRMRRNSQSAGPCIGGAGGCFWGGGRY